MAGVSRGTAKNPMEMSALVRLNLASALQRIPIETRWPMAEALAVHGEYAASRDHTLLLWYGLEPLVPRDRGRAASLLERCPSTMICRFIARRLIAADADGGLAALMPALQARPESYPAFHRDVLDGILEAFEGRKRIGMPEGWASAFAWLTGRGDPDVKAKAAALGLLFGDPKAEAGLRSVVEDRAGSSGARQFALQNLVERRTAGLAPVLFRLLDDPELRASAIRALAAYNDPTTPESILEPICVAHAGRARRRDRDLGVAAGVGVGAAGCPSQGLGAPPRLEHDHRPADPRVQGPGLDRGARAGLGHPPADGPGQGPVDRQIQDDPGVP